MVCSRRWLRHRAHDAAIGSVRIQEAGGVIQGSLCHSLLIQAE